MQLKKTLAGVLIATSFFGFYSCTSENEDEIMDTPQDQPTDGDQNEVITKYSFSADNEDIQNSVQAALIGMNNGDTIYFNEGEFNFTNTLSIQNKKDIVIMGEGMEKSILSFAGQTAGAQGIIAQYTDNIKFENVAVEDAIGDNIKVEDSNGVTFMGIRSEYTGEPSEDNGAYALYPVKSRNVLVQNSYIRGASDAGVYVGQSENVKVIGNTVVENVAGIEIENCRYSEVTSNKAENNTAGILIFDLPGLPVIGNGTNCKIDKNEVLSNNLTNFAPAGNIVGIVPAGTGVMVLSGRYIEIVDNTITNNNVMSISLFSYLVTMASAEDPVKEMITFGVSYPSFNPYVHNVRINGNTITSEGWDAINSEQSELGQVLLGAYEIAGFKQAGVIPQIITDGIFEVPGLFPDFKQASVTNDICAQDNGQVMFMNLDVMNSFVGMKEASADFDCDGVALSEVKFDN